MSASMWSGRLFRILPPILLVRELLWTLKKQSNNHKPYRQWVDMKKAEIGDRVTFTFISGKQVSGIIEYIPVATGDSWIITEVAKGKECGTIYVQNFETMRIR